MRGRFPYGYQVKTWDVDPSVPAGHFRWSTLAELTPFLEQSNIYQKLDLSYPLFGGPGQSPPYSVFPPNRPWVKLIVPVFLCPSDHGQFTREDRAPGNYVACAGTGANGGSAEEADGTFFINSEIRFGDVTDGTSNTLFFSESTLGDGSPPPVSRPIDVRTTFVDAKGTVASGEPLTDAACDAATEFNTTRGAAWADGNFPNGLFNTWYSPNDDRPDCIRHSNPGFKAARSRHTGGVNVLLGDGSVRFISDSIAMAIWRALGSRSGGEVVTQF